MSSGSTTRTTDDHHLGQSKLGSTSSHVSWSAAGIVFAAALIVRIIYLWQVQSLPFFHHPAGDAASYLAWAEQIGQGNFWGGDTFYQAPLYPYFLALVQWFIGPSLFALRLVQALMGASSCVFVFVAASRLVSSRAGLAAGVLLALYPPAIFYDGLIQKTSLALVLLSAFLAVLAGLHARSRWTGYLGAGVLMGLLGLTRENALVLAAVVVVWLWLRLQIDVRVRAKHSAAFVIGIAVILLPVAVRNQAVGGEFTLTTVQMGPNFYIGNHAGATGRYIALQPGHESPPFERQDAKRLAERAVGRSLSDGDVSRYWLDRSLDYIRAQPIDWMMLLATKWMLVWNAYEIADVESYSIYGEWSSLLGTLGTIFHFGVLCPLAVLGVILGWSYRRQLALVYALLLTMAASVALFYVFGRYRFPLVPMLVIPAGVGIVEMVGYARRSARRRPALVGVAVAATALTAGVTNWPMNPEAQLDAMAYSNLGTVLAAQGDLDGAMELFQRAVVGNPQSAEAHYNLGVAVALKGDHARAVDLFDRSRRLNPNAVHIDYNLAVSLERIGQIDRALDHYRRALEIDPNDADASHAIERLGR